MSPRHSILGCILMLLLFACNTQQMNKEDAERSLKVLNSDLINFGSQLSESTEMKTWGFLLNHRDAPIPFYKNSNSFISVKEFSFDEMKGVYKWNPDTENFVLTDESEVIVIFADSSATASVQVTLSQYESVPVSSGEAFPTRLKIEMTEDDKPFWTLDYEAKITDGLPEKVMLSIDGNNYNLNGNFKRTRSGEDGTVNLQVSFDYLMKTLIETKLSGTIAYSRQGYFLKTIEVSQQLFGHDIKGTMDYGSIDPTANDYAASFNAHTRLDIFEKRKGRIGGIVLERTNNNELNDFFIRFADKSSARIGDFLPAFDKLLNLKY